MRYFLSLLLILASLTYCPLGHAEGAAPTYQRQRNASRAGRAGPHMYGWHQPGFIWPGYGGGFYNAAYVGMWYQRPYPYHFDYYRGRFNAPQPQGSNADCPCAQPSVAE